MRYVLTPIFENVGFHESSDESHVQKMHRIRIVEHACRFGVQKCVTEAQRLYSKWMTAQDTFR